MPQKQVSTRKNALPKKTIPLLLALTIVFTALIVIPGAGFAFAAAQESRDPFCGSCHTQPESTYLARSTAAQPVDLASYHTTESTRCIDCHSGKGIAGRIQAEIMGAGNAIKWYSGTAVQPAPLNQPIGDGNCLKCHAQVTQRGYVPKNDTLDREGEAENGHWHVFLPRWQARDPKAATCVRCHSGHATDGDARILYLNQQHTEAVCDSCHRVLGDD